MALNGIKVKHLDGEAEHMRIEPDVTDCESAPRTLARNVTRTGCVASGNSANMLPKTPEHEPANRPARNEHRRFQCALPLERYPQLSKAELKHSKTVPAARPVPKPPN